MHDLWVEGNATGRAEIRFTCGGGFDRPTGHEVDSAVVLGHLVA
jgi:hypothetical protein